MGVKGLFPFLKWNVPDCISHVSLEALRGKRIAVDGNLLLFREYASPWLAPTQPKKHVLWAIRLARLCRKYDITPIVVFDSKQTTPAKAQEHAARTLKRSQAKETLKSTKDRAERLQALGTTLDAMGTLSPEIQEQIRIAVQEARKASILDKLQLIEDPRASDQGNQAEERGKKQKKGKKRKKGREHEDHETETAIGDPAVLEETITKGDAESQSETTIGDTEVLEEITKGDAESQSPEQILQLIKRLINHLRAVADSDTTEGASELALLMKLTQSQSVLPVEELRDLQATTAELIDKLSRRVVKLSIHDVNHAFSNLRKFSIPTQISPDFFEGECTASYFVASGFADFVATEDSDVLVYGVPQLRGFMSVSHGSSSSSSSEISPSLGEMKLTDPVIMRRLLKHPDSHASDHGLSASREVESELESESEAEEKKDERKGERRDESEGMSVSSFIDFAILCGTDFTRPIAGFGIQKIWTLMHTYTSIESALPYVRSTVTKYGPRKGLPRFSIHPTFLTDLAIAREIFTRYPVGSPGITRSLKTREAFDKSIGKFKALCKNVEKWSQVEARILKREGMSVEDIQVLESPELYVQHHKDVAAGGEVSKVARVRSPFKDGLGAGEWERERDRGSDAERTTGGLDFEADQWCKATTPAKEDRGTTVLKDVQVAQRRQRSVKTRRRPRVEEVVVEELMRHEEHGRLIFQDTI